MTGKVIQGSFFGGQPKLPPPVPAMLPPPIQAKTVARPPGPPVTAFAGRPPGPPAPAFGGRPPGPPIPAFAGRQGAVQRHGSGGAFAIEAGQVGLLSSGGRPLPDSVRGKMEAALGADFSNVRVHVGPQAERIGAIAFTVGSDIYFAPGRFQPDTVHGQQLLGHELAHVVQQRAGRVRNPLGSGIAVVQDHALEAEADRLGRHAAAHRAAAQPKMPPGAAQPAARVRISAPISAGPGSYRLTAGAGGHQVGSVMVHARDRGVVEVTDLGVDQSQRGHGIGRMLVASAAKTGLQFGRSKVTLAAQDKGSGHLTQWYKEIGFTQTGVNQRGYPQLEAPISRVLAGSAQLKPAHVAGAVRREPHALSGPNGNSPLRDGVATVQMMKNQNKAKASTGKKTGKSPKTSYDPDKDEEQQENKKKYEANVSWATFKKCCTFRQYVPYDAETIPKSITSKKITDAVYNSNKAFWVVIETSDYDLASAKGKAKMVYTFSPAGAKSLFEDELVCQNVGAKIGETDFPNKTLWKTSENGARGIGNTRLQQLSKFCSKIEAFDENNRPIKV